MLVLRRAAFVVLSALSVAPILGGCASKEDASPGPLEVAADAGADAPEPCPESDFSSAAPLESLAEPAQSRCVWSSFFGQHTDAQVVCSAEGSHGTNEATLIHVQIARELVLAHGFRTVAMEIDDASLALIDRFVNEGDEASMIKSLKLSGKTLGATVQMERFYRSLRDLRLELPEDQPLSLRGIDVAIQLGATVERLFAYLNAVDPATANTFKAQLPSRVSSKAAADKAAVAAGELGTVMENKRADYTSVDAAGYDVATRDRLALDEGYRFLSFYVEGDFVNGNATIGDPAMARNLLALAEQGKVMVVAHEGHCAHDTPSQGKPRSANAFAFGKNVTAALGARFIVVGQLFGGGTELLQNGETERVVLGSGSLEKKLLGAIDSDVALVHTAKFVSVDLTQSWPLDRFEEPTLVPSAQLDGFVWMRKITPAAFR
jgi:erythromycin esterase-like protein